MKIENQKELTECLTVMGDASNLAALVAGQMLLDIENTNAMMKCLYDMVTAYNNVIDIARDVYGAEICGQEYDAGSDAQYIELNRSRVTEWEEKYKGWDENYIFPENGPVTLSELMDARNGKPTAEDEQKINDDLTFYDKMIGEPSAGDDEPALETKIGFYQREIETLTGALARLKAGLTDGNFTSSELEDALDNEYNDLFTEYCDLFEKKHGQLPPAEQARRAYNAAVQRARELEGKDQEPFNWG